MTEKDEKELLTLTRENNYMLKVLMNYFKHDNTTEFMNNILANLVANKFDRFR